MARTLSPVGAAAALAIALGVVRFYALGASVPPIDPIEAANGVLRACHNLSAATTQRSVQGRNCHYRQRGAVELDWWQSWAHCGGQLPGGRPAHFYTSETLRHIVAERVLRLNQWTRIGSSTPNDTVFRGTLSYNDKPAGSSNHYWRTAEAAPDTLADFPVQFFDDTADFAPFNWGGESGHVYKWANGAYHLAPADNTRQSAIVDVLCERPSPAVGYTLTAKHRLPAGPVPLYQHSKRLSALGADVRLCAHQCLRMAWCFAFGHSAPSGDCRLYPQMAADMREVPLAPADGFYYYVRPLVDGFKAACYSALAGDADTHGVAFHRGACYALLAQVADHDAARLACVAKGDAHKLNGGLAVVKTKSMLAALAQSILGGLSSACAFVEGRQSANGTATQPYGQWVYNTPPQSTPMHAPPGAWLPGQPDIATETSYLRACWDATVAGGYLKDGPRLKSDRKDGYALCQYVDAKHESRWHRAAADVTLEPQHVLATMAGVPTVKACGFFCARRPDCASIAHNAMTDVCKLQRFEYAEGGADHIPVTVDKVADAGFVFYDEI